MFSSLISTTFVWFEVDLSVKLTYLLLRFKLVFFRLCLFQRRTFFRIHICWPKQEYTYPTTSIYELGIAGGKQTLSLPDKQTAWSMRCSNPLSHTHTQTPVIALSTTIKVPQLKHNLLQQLKTLIALAQKYTVFDCLTEQRASNPKNMTLFGNNSFRMKSINYENVKIYTDYCRGKLIW